MRKTTLKAGNMTLLWRDKPIMTKSRRSTIGRRFVEASGRMAITKLLREGGLGRDSFVAVPRFSSWCVLSAVSKVATPVPFDFVGSKKINAMLLYEQWGWPLQMGEGDAKRFRGRLMILDRVDSSDMDRAAVLEGPEVFSFSKLLGLPGGALVRKGGRFSEASYNQYHRRLAAKLGHDDTLMDLYKSEVDRLHPKLEKWLKENSLTEALTLELTRRRENMAVLLGSSMIEGWMEWMVREAKRGIGPGLVPLFKGKDVKSLSEIQNMLARYFTLETQIYHFNWSGNPFRPDYQNCLAVPLHGQVENFEGIIHALEKKYGAKKDAGRYSSGRP